ncbi:MAG: M20/M25/M40 family metallo-hydrolase, partial [Anaerolineae bacterium]|nr:M20/M25/M40 family metallo-hydrolase [Anaerolineae bacterium]
MGHQTQRLTSSLLIISIILFLLAAQPYAAQAERAQLDGKQFGPVLFLLSPTAEQANLLPSLPVTIHATLFDQPVDRYIASGDAAAETQIITAGVDVRVLDSATSGKAYYFIDTSAANARQLAATYGTMVYGDPMQSLLAAPQASEAALVAELPAAGVPIALLSTDAIVFGRPAAASLAATVPPAVDPAVQALIDQVSETRIHDLIADLSGARTALIDGTSVTIPTRYSFAAGITNAEAYVRQHYAALGLTTRTLPWAYSSYSGRNITADITGIVHPERIWLVGGHLDSTSTDPYRTAPGADDNASGTATTLALAEILHDLHFADTIRFVHFTGEEQGMWGSKVYARDLQISGAQVMGYINLDMIGWDSDGDRTVELHSGTGSPSVALANAFVSANERYGQSLRLELKQSTASRFSDHSSFWDYGYASFLTLENFYDDAIVRDRNPWYHTTGDLLSRVDLNYVARSARTALATMTELAGIITGPLPTATATLTPSPTATWTTTPTATSTRTPTTAPAPGLCQQLIANGGFEATAAWVMPSTAYPAAY